MLSLVEWSEEPVVTNLNILDDYGITDEELLEACSYCLGDTPDLPPSVLWTAAFTMGLEWAQQHTKPNVRMATYRGETSE